MNSSLRLALFSVLAAGSLFAAASADEAIEIGSRRELFVDRHLIESLRDVRLELRHPQPQEIVLECDQPWEGSSCGYFRVLKEGNKYRMWYMAYHWPFEAGEAERHPFFVAYAESDDGMAWHKPNLGLYEFAGSKANNICCTDVVDNFTPFLDANPRSPPDARYKAVGIGTGGLLAFQSPDGIHWTRLQETPILTQGAFDTQNVAFWDESLQQYRAYIRDFHSGIRDIRTCTSEDFKTWTEPKILEFPSGTPDEQLYTNGVSPYHRAPHLYLGFPTRYVERKWSPSLRALPDVEHRELRSKVGERIGTAITDGLFMSSRDGTLFQRWGEAFLRNGPERHGTWVYGDCYQAYGLVETAGQLPGSAPELSLYVPENYWHRSVRVRRHTLRLDGFVAANAPLSGPFSGTGGGELVTKPIIFAGKRLTLNFATSAAGNARVEVQDANGRPLPGFALDDCDELFGDTPDRAVSWNENADVSAIAGRPVKLRFVLSDADLFSFQFVE